MLIPLIGLAELRRHLGLAAGDTQDDARLYGAMIAASAQMMRSCGRQFAPSIETRAHTLRVTGAVLALEGDLLELRGLADVTGAIALGAVKLLPAGGVAALLQRTDGARFSGTVQVTGVWGWHDAPARMWVGSGDSVQSAPLMAAATTLLVSNADGADAEQRSPRLQAGRLLRIEDEWVYIHRVESATTLIVERGMGGTTPAAHALGTPISVYAPPRALADLALRWTAWLVQHSDPPAHTLQDALAPYRRPRVA